MAGPENNSMQLFVWHGNGQKQGTRTYYNRFSLNGTLYEVGDAVLLYPEDDSSGTPHYVGKIISAFVDSSQELQDPHCIEIKWFERRTNLEPSTKGIEESEKEVFELDDTDINPIGCISGKCTIVRATHYEHAWHKMKEYEGAEWYFCRGYFRQLTNSFESYSLEEIDGAMPHQAALQYEPQPAHHRSYGGGGSRARTAAAVYQDDDDEPPTGKRAKATGRACLQCGATSTPQWREGPQGPKTLCNACGVRYVRSLQKGQKVPKPAAAAAPAGGQARASAAQQKNLQGSPSGATTIPRAQQSSTVAKPKQAAPPSARRTSAAPEAAEGEGQGARPSPAGAGAGKEKDKAQGRREPKDRSGSANGKTTLSVKFGGFQAKFAGAEATAPLIAQS